MIGPVLDPGLFLLPFMTNIWVHSSRQRDDAVRVKELDDVRIVVLHPVPILFVSPIRPPDSTVPGRDKHSKKLGRLGHVG